MGLLIVLANLIALPILVFAIVALVASDPAALLLDLGLLALVALVVLRRLGARALEANSPPPRG